MKVITTKLKRYKVVWYFITIPFAPIFIILGVLVRVGEILEDLLGFFDKIRTSLVYKIANILKFESIAKKQYKNNPDKFKRKKRFQ